MELTPERISEILGRIRNGEKITDIVMELRQQGFVIKGKGLKSLLPPEYHEEYVRAKEAGKQRRQHGKVGKTKPPFPEPEREPQKQDVIGAPSPLKEEGKPAEVEKELTRELSTPKREPPKEGAKEPKPEQKGFHLSPYLWGALGIGGLLALLWWWKGRGKSKATETIASRQPSPQQPQTTAASDIEELLKW